VRESTHVIKEKFLALIVMFPSIRELYPISQRQSVSSQRGMRGKRGNLEDLSWSVVGVWVECVEHTPYWHTIGRGEAPHLNQSRFQLYVKFPYFEGEVREVYVRVKGKREDR
jgi:hypothetical protein